MKNKIYGDMRCGEWHYTYKGDKIMVDSFTLAEIDFDNDESSYDKITWTKEGLPLINGQKPIYRENNYKRR